MTENTGKVVSINGNLVSVEFDGNVSMNEICYVKTDGTELKSEVIRIKGNVAQIQVYEMTLFLPVRCCLQISVRACSVKFMMVFKIRCRSWQKKQVGSWNAAIMRKD